MMNGMPRPASTRAIEGDLPLHCGESPLFCSSKIPFESGVLRCASSSLPLDIPKPARRAEQGERALDAASASKSAGTRKRSSAFSNPQDKPRRRRRCAFRR